MILVLGSHGDDVRTLQVALTSLGYKLGTPDGEFGPKTEAAVRSFQRDRGLVADGIVGPKTWQAVLKPGETPIIRPPFPEKRCFPLRCLADGRKPVITSGHKFRNPDRSNHNGVDLFYRYLPTDPAMKVGDSGRTKKWWIPPNTYSCAPFSGRIIVAGNSPTGMRAWLQHNSGWLAGGFHFDELLVKVGDVLELGDDIGRVNDNPRDRGDADHLHFELHWGDLGTYPRGTVDPELMLATTPYLPAR